jgi:hypothetical protein
MKSLLLLLLAASGAFAVVPPNILFMLSDDQAWSCLSCRILPDMPDSKNSIVQTPNIARLAEQGMRFSAAYAPAPVCSPTQLEGGDVTHLLSGSSDPVKRSREPLVFHFPHYQGDSPHSAILSGQARIRRKPCQTAHELPERSRSRNAEAQSELRFQ